MSLANDAKRITLGYDLDCGGYGCDPIDREVTDHNPDLMGWLALDASPAADFAGAFGVRLPRKWDSVCYITVDEMHGMVPPRIVRTPGDRVQTLQATLRLRGSDHDCVYCDDEGEIQPDEWSDSPGGPCERCEGDGYIDSPAVTLAWYAPIKDGLRFKPRKGATVGQTETALDVRLPIPVRRALCLARDKAWRGGDYQISSLCRKALYGDRWALRKITERGLI